MKIILTKPVKKWLDKGNISLKELKVLKARVKILLSLGDKELDRAIKAKILFEIGGGNHE